MTTRGPSIPHPRPTTTRALGRPAATFSRPTGGPSPADLPTDLPCRLPAPPPYSPAGDSPRLFRAPPCRTTPPAPGCDARPARPFPTTRPRLRITRVLQGACSPHHPARPWPPALHPHHWRPVARARTRRISDTAGPPHHPARHPPLAPCARLPSPSPWRGAGGQVCSRPTDSPGWLRPQPPGYRRWGGRSAHVPRIRRALQRASPPTTHLARGRLASWSCLPSPRKERGRG